MNRYLFSFLLAALALFPIVASAQVSENGPVKVASVNIQNARVLSYEGGEITVGFELNNGEGMQSDVRYSVSLVSNEGGKQTLVDEKIYEEILTLAPNSSLSREVIYDVPTTLDGSYTVLVRARNQSGFLFGITVAGEVTLVASENGVSIDPLSCRTEVKPVTATGYIPHANVILLPEESFRLLCVIKNPTGAPLSVTPRYITREGSAFGEEIAVVGGDTGAIALSEQPEQPLILTLPRSEKAGLYNLTVTLDGASGMISFPYTVAGPTAKIANMTLDKDFYIKNETARLSLLWSATTKEIVANVVIKSDTGRSCAAAYESLLVLDEGSVFSTIEIPILNACYNPEVTLVLKDATGEVFDDMSVVFETTSVKRPVKWGTIALLVLGVLALLGAVLWYIKKKQAANNSATVNTIALLLFLFAWGITSTASAATYTIQGSANGPLHFTINTNKSSYQQNETISVTTSIQSESTNVDTASLEGGVNGALVSIIGENSISSGGSLFGTATIGTAQASAGVFSASFKGGIKVQDAVQKIPASGMVYTHDPVGSSFGCIPGSCGFWGNYKRLIRICLAQEWNIGDPYPPQTYTLPNPVTFTARWRFYASFIGFETKEVTIPAGESCIEEYGPSTPYAGLFPPNIDSQCFSTTSTEVEVWPQFRC
ncbi:MAG: hypothetical protein ACOYMZ_01040 [Minisyncoccia bacterium]